MARPPKRSSTEKGPIGEQLPAPAQPSLPETKPKLGGIAAPAGRLASDHPAIADLETADNTRTVGHVPAWAPGLTLLAALVLLVALALGAGNSGQTLAPFLLDGIPSGFAAIARSAAWLTVVAVGLVGAGWLPALRHRRETLWLAAAGAALIALRFRELSDPLPQMGIAEPLRDSLWGTTPALWSAVAVGGIVAAFRENTFASRAVACIGALGLWLHAWMPAAWLGETVLPLQAAFTGLRESGDLPTRLHAPVLVAAEALVSTCILAWGLLDMALPRTALWVLGAACAAVAITASQPQGLGILVQTAATIALAAAVIAQGVAQLGDNWWPRVEVTAESVVVFLIIAAFLVLKSNGLGYSATDESLYFYAAAQWSQGHWPYRDFFFSHPPLHIAIPALLYWVFGFHFLIGKWLSALAALGAGLAVWRIARDRLGVLWGVAALAMDLLACEVLQASTNLTGVNLTTFWMMWGIWAAMQRRYLLAGLLLGAAASTGFYAFGAFLVVVTLAVFLPGSLPKGSWLSRALAHPAGQITLGFLAVWGTLNAGFYLAAGDRFIDGVYEYHFAKKAKVEGFTPLSQGPTAIISNFALLLGAKDFRVTLYYHAAQAWLALSTPFIVIASTWIRSGEPPIKLAKGSQLPPSPWTVLWQPKQWWYQDKAGFGLWSFTLALAMLVEFAQFKERYDFYYSLLIPLACLAASAGLALMAELAHVALGPQPGHALHPMRTAATGLLLVLGLWQLGWVSLNNQVNETAFPSEFKATSDSKGLGERLAFTWQDAPGPHWLNDWTLGLFWAKERIRGNLETGAHHYLWNKKKYFEKADEIAAYIRDHSTPQDTLTGASDYAPLLALLSGRRLAGGQIDTNSKVFSTGAVPLEKFWDAVCADRVQFVIAAPMSYFATESIRKRATIIDNFHMAAGFDDTKLKHFGRVTHIELWERNATDPLKSCTYSGKRGVGPSLEDDNRK